MTDAPEQNAPLPSQKLLQMLQETAQRGSQMHEQFLDGRQKSLDGMRALLEAQIVEAFPTEPGERPALFSSRQIDEFGVGQISKCLGPSFAKYDSRRIPRIPNGDLKMMSRIVAIEGTPRDFSRPASVTAEYDVPLDAWYLRDNHFPEIPTSLFLEIALQPCGFLSAYLDTYAFVPGDSFYFRNLDGSMRFLQVPDLRGATITTRARMLTSVVSGGTVIQKFAYELSSAGQTICVGESTFGYFSIETMANQVGLDGGRPVRPTPGAGAQGAVHLDLSQMQAAPHGQPHHRLAGGRLNFLDEVQMLPAGGSAGLGYVYAVRRVNPQDWFFPFHFYRDPVMPGSLGIEAMLEAVQSFALASGMTRGMRSPRFDMTSASAPLTWRYRGQITPQHNQMELEAHIRGVERDASGSLLITADASLWIDGLRIYELKNAAIQVREA